MGSDLRNDVENFIRHNFGQNVPDNHVATTLRSLSPTVQRAVIDQGDLTTARDPSAVLKSRISDAVYDARRGDRKGGSDNNAGSKKGDRKGGGDRSRSRRRQRGPRGGG